MLAARRSRSMQMPVAAQSLPIGVALKLLGPRRGSNHSLGITLGSEAFDRYSEEHAKAHVCCQQDESCDKADAEEVPGEDLPDRDAYNSTDRSPFEASRDGCSCGRFAHRIASLRILPENRIGRSQHLLPTVVGQRPVHRVARLAIHHAKRYGAQVQPILRRRSNSRPSKPSICREIPCSLLLAAAWGLRSQQFL